MFLALNRYLTITMGIKNLRAKVTIIVPCLLMLTAARTDDEKQKVSDPSNTRGYVFDMRDDIGKPSCRVLW